MKYTFPVKLYPHTLSVVQSIESKVKSRSDVIQPLKKDHYQSFIDFIHFDQGQPIFLRNSVSNSGRRERPGTSKKNSKWKGM